MSQTTLTKFFNNKKRPATDDIVSSKNKITCIKRADSFSKSDPKTPLPKQTDLVARQIEQPAIVTSNQPEVSNNGEVQLARNNNQVGHQESAGAFVKKASASNVIISAGPSKPISVTAARKELSLGDIRKKLAASSKFAQIKASADRLSKEIRELNESHDKTISHEPVTRNLKKFKSIKVEVPQSPSKQLTIRKELLSPKKEAVVEAGEQKPIISPRKVFVSPIKSPSKVPAYIKVGLSSASSSLPLPYHYRFLAELFRGMETVIALLYNRNEQITFSKLKPSVQEMLKRNFKESHLAQIKHLVPDFYNFELQKNKSFSNTSHKDTYELVITPNFPNDIKVMNPTVLLERQRYFYEALLTQVKKHHAKFCSKLNPPIEVPNDKIVRWHPDFELEKIPDIGTAKLPEIQKSAEKCSSAQDVLARVRELFNCNTKMGRAMEKLAQAKARGLTEQEKIATGIEEVQKLNGVTQKCQPSIATAIQEAQQLNGVTQKSQPCIATAIQEVQQLNGVTQKSQPSIATGIQVGQQMNGVTPQKSQPSIATGIQVGQQMNGVTPQKSQPSIATGIQVGQQINGVTTQKIQPSLATDIQESPKLNSVTDKKCLPSTSDIKILNPALRNLPAALLEKVKAKQAAKALEAMTRPSENDQLYLTYRGLPDLARTLRYIFVTEKKNVLALNIVLSKLVSSFKSTVSANNLQKDIKLLAEEAPEWLNLHQVRNTTYLKLDKNANLKRITSKLEATANKYKY